MLFILRIIALAAGVRRHVANAMLGLAIPLVIFAEPVLQQSGSALPDLRIPSNVAWTDETIALASSGDPVRGLVIARRCERCHGAEGFTSDSNIPNLAALDKFTFWKQMDDFRSGKRSSTTMQRIAAVLSRRESADLAAYYAILPASPDPTEERSFPQPPPGPAHLAAAARLVVFGDAQRHSPVPSLPWSCWLCQGSAVVSSAERNLHSESACSICRMESC